MRLDFSLERGGVAALLAALGAGGTLLFFAGMLVGTASAAQRPAAVPGVDARLAADSLAAHAPAGPCPPATADSTAVPAPAAAPAVREEDGGGAVAVFRDERRALAMLERMSARGVDVVIEAEAARDGEPVFRVRPARGAEAP